MNVIGKMVVETSASRAQRQESESFNNFVSESFKKFQAKDWGQTSEDSVIRNNEAITGEPDQIFAVYKDGENVVWIITEWDESVTTILLPSDY